VPCVCVFLSWLGCHYCGRDWEQGERLPPSAGTTCSDEWHSVWLLLPWDGNEYVQVCIIMITSYQEQSHIGNYHAQVCIIMITSSQELSHSCNALRLVFTLYPIYLLSLFQSVLCGFFLLFPLSLKLFVWEQFKYTTDSFSEIPVNSVFTVTSLSLLTPYNVRS
jgi:hypothetical protein